MSDLLAKEVNFDGLIGPTHNYGGMSTGNLASTNNAGLISNPREAALQGLEKMRHLYRAGLGQGILPPLPRPSLDVLVAAGFTGSDQSILEDAARVAPDLLSAAYSASSMWAANAATVSPSADTKDGRLHLSAANLSTMLHRSFEHPDTTANLISIFSDEDLFAVHPALPMHSSFADEGAANHVRLCESHGAPGVELFVYGRDGGQAATAFPARQTLRACESLARSHCLAPERTVFARQSAAAIDAGAFHNDVVCVGSLNTLFFHELAFEDTGRVLSEIRAASAGLFELVPVMVPSADVPIEDAIKSYLFNSQLLQWPGEDRLVLLAPMETYENPRARAYCDGLGAGNGPIGRVEYVDVRQSMRNGGGPACLRLRVVMTPEQISACHQPSLLDDAAIDGLQAIVKRTYRDRVSPEDFTNIAFARECWTAREEILSFLDLTDLI